MLPPTFIDFCFEIRNRKDEGKMNTNSASKKAISMVCLIAGIILLAVALIQDISGSGAGWRGPALIIGAIGSFTGNVFIPDIKTSQKHR